MTDVNKDFRKVEEAHSAQNIHEIASKQKPFIVRSNLREFIFLVTCVQKKKI